MVMNVQDSDDLWGLFDWGWAALHMYFDDLWLRSRRWLDYFDYLLWCLQYLRSLFDDSDNRLHWGQVLDMLNWLDMVDVLDVLDVLDLHWCRMNLHWCRVYLYWCRVYLHWCHCCVFDVLRLLVLIAL